MNKKVIRLVFILFFSIYSHTIFSQSSTFSREISKDITLKSEFLEEDRTIQVYLPKDYSKDNKRSFPVLYVLDGQEYFLHGIAYQEMLYFRDKSPAFIVIGINTDRRKRRVLFSEESEKFINFLDRELIPYVDTNFRTKNNSERLFFGWEMAGGLGFEILSKRNNLFSGFILASPTHSTDKRMNAVKKLKDNLKMVNKFLLVSAAPEEHWITQDTTFLSIIQKNTYNQQPWRYTVFDREDHYTTPLKTIHEGLSDYFKDYKPIRLRSIKAYDDYGGLVALRAYYKNRGLRYGLSQDIHKETKHFLLNNAMLEDNYKRFETYVKALDGYIETNTRGLWFNKYARFYLKHGNEKEAFRIFNYGLNKIPESTLLLEGLGDFYVYKNNISKAKIKYKKAIYLNPNLENIKKKLEELN